MQRFAILAAFVVVGCGQPDEREANGAAPVSCGDRVCGLDENTLSCPSDCFTGDLTLDTRELAVCAKDRPLDNVGADVEVTLQFAESLASVSFGALMVGEFASGLHGVLISLEYDVAADVLRLPFRHDTTTGAYHSLHAGWAGYGGSLQITPRFGYDYTLAGKRDEPIKPYLFRAESYVTGAKVVREADYSATIEWTERGPLVELLGLGPTPPNPFTLSLHDAGVEIAKQQLDVSLARKHAERGVSIEWSTAFRRRVTLAHDEPVSLTLAGQASAGEQHAKLVKNTIAATFERIALTSDFYERGMLDGILEIEVRDGRMPHAATMTFSRRSRPHLVVRCL
jgi:hypothetical protein